MRGSRNKKKKVFARFSLENYAMQQLLTLFTESLEGKVESILQFLLLKARLKRKLATV